MRVLFALLVGAATLAYAQDTAEPSSTTVTDASVTATVATESSTVTEVTSSESSTSTVSTSSREPVTHTIGVAKGGHTFEPDVTLAVVGDTITFQFYPTNHSVVRAEYGYPCIPYENTGIDKIGFFSGFKPVDAILSEPPEFSIVVNDTTPIFFYCGAAGSCIDWQMVGVINPNATTSLVTQKQLAKDSSFMLLPGEPWPEESEDPFTTTSSTNPSATSSSAESSSGSTATASSSHGLSTGAIAGIAIGGAAVLLAAAVLLYICGRNSRRAKSPAFAPTFDNRPGTGHGTISGVPFNSHQSMMSYGDHTKHMSMHSNVTGVSSALPGYAQNYEPVPMSPPLHPSYRMSESLSPAPIPSNASDVSSPRQTYAVPAYPSHPNANYAHGPQYGVPPPPPQVHEMAGSDGVPNSTMTPISPAPQQGGGIMNFINQRTNTEKSGVERYS